MNTIITLDKAKYLAQEMNQTTQAGTNVAKRLNDLIASTETLIEIVPGSSRVIVLDDVFVLDEEIISLYHFLNDVGMLDD